jgi:RHS repeat-associated protein
MGFEQQIGSEARGWSRYLGSRPHRRQARAGQQPTRAGWTTAGSASTGAEHAGSLSLVQMGARLYSPALGRFLSVDPINRIDLNGRWWSWLKKAVKRAAKIVKSGVKLAAKKVGRLRRPRFGWGDSEEVFHDVLDLAASKGPVEYHSVEASEKDV